MRFFYAIELDPNTRELLIREQAKLKREAMKANFTRNENLHLTLRFMGEVEPAYLPVLIKIAQVIAKKTNSFQLSLTHPGTFTRGHKNIVWWGIRREEQLNTMQKLLEEEIRLNGFSPELKPYTPHITLAREWVSQKNMKEVLSKTHSLNHAFNVNHISLMESTRIEGKLTYICRYRAGFN